MQVRDGTRFLARSHSVAAMTSSRRLVSGVFVPPVLRFTNLISNVKTYRNILLSTPSSTRTRRSQLHRNLYNRCGIYLSLLSLQSYWPLTASTTWMLTGNLLLPVNRSICHATTSLLSSDLVVVAVDGHYKWHSSSVILFHQSKYL